jgi:hypothetical protein
VAARLALLLGLGGLLVTGCGGDQEAGTRLEPGTVAQVGSARIPRSQFDHFLRAECLKLERLHPVRGGAHRGTPERPPCAQQRQAARTSVMTLLITARWLRQEARRRRVVIGRRQRARDLAALREERFVGDRLSYERFRGRTGLTGKDMYLLLQWIELREALSPAAPDAIDRLIRMRYRPQTLCLSGFAAPECGFVAHP